MCKRGQEKVRGARGKVKIFFYDENVIKTPFPHKTISDFKH